MRPLGELPDGQLIERCIVGDRPALGELYQRYKPEAMRFIRHSVRNGEDLDDVLQEVFVEVSRSLRRFEGRAAFSTWLHRICVRTAVRHMKRRFRQMGDPTLEEVDSDQADPAHGPDEGTEARERTRRAMELVEKIAPKKRMVLILHDLEGVSPKEISTMVGAPVLTVRTRLFYARRELAAMASSDPMLAEFFIDGPKGQAHGLPE